MNCAVRKAADAAISAIKRELVAMAHKHGRTVRLVDPKHTTTDCTPRPPGRPGRKAA